MNMHLHTYVKIISSLTVIKPGIVIYHSLYLLLKVLVKSHSIMQVSSYGMVCLITSKVLILFPSLSQHAKVTLCLPWPKRRKMNLYHTNVLSPVLYHHLYYPIIGPIILYNHYYYPLHFTLTCLMYYVSSVIPFFAYFQCQCCHLAGM